MLGVVEGLTEFLPISSTGHLILASHFLNVPESESNKAFEVIIQSGAILAVVVYYAKDLLKLVRETFLLQEEAVKKSFSIVVGFIPAGVIGLLAGKWIKAHLFGYWPVIAAMAGGGVAMIAIERFLKTSAPTPQPHARDLALIPPANAFSIGCFQCLAMWPGMSRSMVTILGGRLLKLSAFDAATFSFYLSIPTLIGATVVEVIRNRAIFMNGDPEFLTSLAVGSVVSFVVALIVIRVFLDYLKKHSLEAFGWYRVVLASVLWWVFS